MLYERYQDLEDSPSGRSDCRFDLFGECVVDALGAGKVRSGAGGRRIGGVWELRGCYPSETAFSCGFRVQEWRQ
jgi:hypothetical protein